MMEDTLYNRSDGLEIKNSNDSTFRQSTELLKIFPTLIFRNIKYLTIFAVAKKKQKLYE